MPRAKKPCNVPGCPILVTGKPRCPTHQREWEKRRGTKQERGYDAHHEQLKVQLTPGAYGQLCPSCGLRMLPGQRLNLMHNATRTAYLGMGHARCNESDAGKAAHSTI